jgi:hypothetical protein
MQLADQQPGIGQTFQVVVRLEPRYGRLARLERFGPHSILNGVDFRLHNPDPGLQ